MTFTFAELFAGIGGFRTALEPLGGTCVFASEIDKYAMKSYRAIHGGDELQGDITKIDAQAIPDHDLLVAGFPCQSFSVAGHQKGFEDARGTLFFEVARIAAEKKPKTLLLENVKGLISHDKGKTLKIMLQMLDSIGYAVDFTVLNSKHFGVPQNRERIFIMCSRDAIHQSWHIAGNGMLAKAKRTVAAMGIRTFNFNWPQNDAVTTRLRDVLEHHVKASYYLSDTKTAELLHQLNARQLQLPMVSIDLKGETSATRRGIFKTDVVGALDHNCYTGVVVEGEIEVVGRVDINGHDILKRVYGVDGIAPTLNSMGGGSREPKIAIECVGNVNPSQRGMNGYVFSEDGLSPTLTINKGEGPKILLEQFSTGEGLAYALSASYPKGTCLSDMDSNRRTHILEPVEFSQANGECAIGSSLDVAHTLNASDWRGLNRNQKQNAVLEVEQGIGCSLRTRSYRDQEQQLEVRDEPISNTVTSVAKDAMVLEVKQDPFIWNHGKLIVRKDGLSTCLDKCYNFFPDNHGQRTGVIEEVLPVLTPDYAHKEQNGRRFKDDGEEAFTLTAQDRHGVAIGAYPHYRIRKLTPLECFRLQGFSDKQLWDAKNAGISDSQLYKQAGNAVTVNVISAIGERMVPFMSGLSQDADDEGQVDLFDVLQLKQNGAGQPYEYKGGNAFNGEKTKIPGKDNFD